MKSVIYLGAAALFLSACGGAGDDAETGADTQVTAERTDCEVVASDPEAQETFDQIGITADTFCDCMGKVIASKPEMEQAQITMTLSKVAEGMRETGEGAEDVVGELMMADEQDTAGEDFAKGVNLVGQTIDEISGSYEDDQTCPVS
ncbi:hypothetical protein WNY37_00205 [Henriciella sp. AS95]|uniref:hypothetical protein n=1 Tax=Henriciella sp. AS95 TaxID=3135782 RepID=UPI00317FBB11